MDRRSPGRVTTVSDKTVGPIKHPGRPPLGDQRMRRVNVMLDRDTIERARELGGGKNLSAGLRLAVSIAAAKVPPEA